MTQKSKEVQKASDLNNNEKAQPDKCMFHLYFILRQILGSVSPLRMPPYPPGTVRAVSLQTTDQFPRMDGK